jgi:uracil-DNA glycosylase
VYESGDTEWLRLFDHLPADWCSVMQEQMSAEFITGIQNFLQNESSQYTIFPRLNNVFKAFECTPYEKVRVVLLGQDPYHDENQAHGLCFSVQDGVTIPPSLRNILKELESDLGCPVPETGNLQYWAEQGILLLNTVMTVRAHVAGSHRNCGWEEFTDQVIMAVNNKKHPVVFVLWGTYAQKKQSLIDVSRHCIVANSHPSPLSAYRGFIGSRPFSTINRILRDYGQQPIDWKISGHVDFNDLQYIFSRKLRDNR